MEKGKATTLKVTRSKDEHMSCFANVGHPFHHLMSE